jgi:MFS family permease
MLKKSYIQQKISGLVKKFYDMCYFPRDDKPLLFFGIIIFLIGVVIGVSAITFIGRPNDWRIYPTLYIMYIGVLLGVSGLVLFFSVLFSSALEVNLKSPSTKNILKYLGSLFLACIVLGWLGSYFLFNSSNKCDSANDSFKCSVQWGLMSVIFVQVYIFVISILKIANRGELAKTLSGVLIGLAGYNFFYGVLNNNQVFPTASSTLWVYISIISSAAFGIVTVIVNGIILFSGIDRYLKRKQKADVD